MLKNNGFASLYNLRKAELILMHRNSGKKYSAQLADDPRFWQPGETSVISAEIGISENMPTGEYNLYLNLPDISDSLRTNPAYSIRMANENVWEAATGYNNLLVTIQVGEADGEPYSGDHFFVYENNSPEIDDDEYIERFEHGIGYFAGEAAGNATGSLEIVTGYIGNSLKVSYNIVEAWSQYGAVLKFETLEDFSSKPILSFWYQGDGSSRSIRLFVKQDNDGNGRDDDWWYTETFKLNSTDWREASIDLRTLQPLSWHTNSKETFDLTNVYSLEFIIPSGVAASGCLILDDIRVSEDESLPTHNAVAPESETIRITTHLQKLYFDSETNCEQVEIYSTGGARAFSTHNTTHFEVSLHSGIYVVKASCNGKLYLRKVVVE